MHIKQGNHIVGNANGPHLYTILFAFYCGIQSMNSILFEGKVSLIPLLSFARLNFL